MFWFIPLMFCVLLGVPVAFALGMIGFIGLIDTLQEMGVDDARASEICEMAAADPTAPTNPVPLDPANLRTVFDAAMTGQVAAT